jgi:alpha-amylase/alpha-mannosidase (GH57 family)
MQERLRRQDCRCRRIAFAIPKTRASNSPAGSICTKSFWHSPQGGVAVGRQRLRRVLAIAHSLGIQWMATDEEVLGRSSGAFFGRDGTGRLPAHLGEKLYNIHRYEKGSASMNLVFRDHTISDLIGFVYSGMPPLDAARHLLGNIREAARPVLSKGRDAVVSVILDGENAWEYYPQVWPGVSALLLRRPAARVRPGSGYHLGSD